MVDRVELRRAVVIGAAASVGLALVVLCFRPGYMSGDPLDQLGQARSGLFTSRHPPIMAWVWSGFDRLWPGPIGMLILQNIAFWSSLAVIAYLASRIPTPVAAALVLAVGLSPACFSFLGTVWKDVHTGVFLLLASALLLAAERTRRAGLALMSLPFLWYGGSVRANGPPALLPLALWAAAILLPAARRRHKVMAGAALAAALVATAAFTNDRLARGMKAYGLQYTLLYDIAAISVGSNQNLLPEYLQQGPGGVSLARLRQIYTPESPDPLFFGPAPHLWGTQSDDEWHLVARQWVHEVAAHPGLYLRFRLVIVDELLQIHSIGYTFHHGIDKNHLGITLERTRWNRAAMAYLDSFAQTPFFRSWVYLMLMAGVLVLATWRRQLGTAELALAGSALLYAAPYAVLSPAGEFRYLWWPVLVALVLPVIAFGKRPPRPTIEA